jgi:allantoin racemase
VGQEVKKILVLAPFAMDERSLDNRRAQAQEVDFGPETEIHFRAVRAGPTTYDTYHDWLLAELGLLEAGMEAEAEGYEAICIDTLSDAAVNVLRSVVDIPVFGAGLPSYLMAVALGRSFSVLTQWDPWIPLYERVLVETGLRDRCVSIRSIDMKPDLENLLGGKLEVVLPRLVEEGFKCLEDGADVIVLGSTTMHQAHAPLAAALPVPVINPGPTSYKLTQAAVELGLSHSRRAYLKETAPKKETLRAMMQAAAELEAGTRG